jgi:alpha-L-fucosidase
LLNVGPTPDGEIPQLQQDRLRTLGEWMRINGESIHGTFFGTDLTVLKMDTSNHAYLHVDPERIGELKLSLFGRKIVRAWMLDGGAEVALSEDKRQLVLPDVFPDARISTIALELEPPPSISISHILPPGF